MANTNLTNIGNWTNAVGEWEIIDTKLRQSNDKDITRTFQNVGVGDYIAVFINVSFRINKVL